MKVSKRKSLVSGFTLIELLVAIAIIAILSAIVIRSLSSARAKGRDAKRVRDLQELRTAVELYVAANGHAPDLGDPTCIDASSGDMSCFANDFDGGPGKGWSTLAGQLDPYLKKLPKDPCGLGCYDPSNPSLRYEGYFTYVYEAPSILGQGFGAEKVTPSSYFIYAENKETNNNTLLGYIGYGSFGSF